MTPNSSALGVPLPEVNSADSGPRIDPKDLLAAWRETVTAGASQPVHEPLSSWNAYVSNVSWPATKSPGHDSSDLLYSIALRDMLMTQDVGATEEIATNEVRHTLNFGQALLGLLSDQIKPNGSGVVTKVAIPNQLPFNYISADLTTAAGRYGSVLDDARNAQTEALAEIRRDLDTARSALSRRSPADLVTELTEDRGLGQLVVSKALDVSPTAVRKWRRGESARPEHRQVLARLAALCVTLDELDLHDPSGWLEMAISDDSELTPLDVFAGGRSDLVATLAAGVMEPHEVLDEFDPNWRVIAPLGEYKVIQHSDGSRSAVPREAD
jgi:transcriptional regulator with XRE-family HTH domain